MAVEFNLLPDVKLEYIKAQKLRNRITQISVLVSSISLAILLITVFSVEIVQKKALSDANRDITTSTNNIQSQPQVTKALTIQNQLQTLTKLHSDKHIMSRLFGYLSQVTPPNASLARVSIDTSTNTMTIDGTADSATTVNKFIDTLKFTKYTVGASDNSTIAFPSVVETNFNISAANVNYTINVQYDANLFANNLKNSEGSTAAPNLQVPTQTTTRSALSNLFSGGQ